SFQHIYAPFSGVITRRNVDIGTLVNAGNGGASQQLFFLAQTSPLRVYVRVPEIYANTIHAGLGAHLEVTQYPGKKIEGKVTRTAEAIDLATRTLNTEVDVPNRDGTLLPGGYAQVHLEVKVSGSRRSEEHTSELQSPYDLVCRLLLEKKKTPPQVHV